MRKQKGQAVLILILVMTVALAIGLSVIQRSLSDVSTSSKVEQSSRAYSAAEAGIEKAIQVDQVGGTIISFSPDLGNNSKFQDVQANRVPAANQALEYPPLAKEELAQVWLADPQTLAKSYDQSSIDVYWGLPNLTSDKPALEVTVISFNGTAYQSQKFFIDSDDTRVGSNGFQLPSLSAANPTNCANPPGIDTSLGTNRTFFCKTTLTGLTPTLMLLRARILYSNDSQPFAVQPLGGNCGTSACSLPVQSRLFTSTGVSGVTQRKVQVFQEYKVVPPYFDYAIFSTGEINK
ncbi:MAG: pilus assembly PilX N-terminal domain-containing protein [Candidatus Daviesbacteria bacterium]|nr:pilus assembly PilX N-terminal domain-containing protein [Candidatus Daviesbacteria bacterium]